MANIVTTCLGVKWHTGRLELWGTEVNSLARRTIDVAERYAELVDLVGACAVWAAAEADGSVEVGVNLGATRTNDADLYGVDEIEP